MHRSNIEIVSVCTIDDTLQNIAFYFYTELECTDKAKARMSTSNIDSLLAFINAFDLIQDPK